MPHVRFVSSNGAQELVLFSHYGAGEDEYGEIEVRKAGIEALVLKDLPTDTFVSGRGVELGMSRADIISRFGSCLKADEKSGDGETIQYQIDNADRDPDLKGFNYPVYYAEYEFERGKLRALPLWVRISVREERVRVRPCNLTRSSVIFGLNTLRAGSVRSDHGLARPARTAAGAERRRRARCGAGVLVAEVDATLGQVVRRHLNRDLVAGKNADAVLLHATGGVGDDLVPVVELHTAAGVGKHLDHHALELEHLLFRHSNSLWRVTRIGKIHKTKWGADSPLPVFLARYQ